MVERDSNMLTLEKSGRVGEKMRLQIGYQNLQMVDE
jgi:hypothetical protein